MKNLFYSVLLLVVLLLIYSQGSVDSIYNEPDEERQTLWGIFENIILPQEDEMDSGEDYGSNEVSEDGDISDKFEEFNERSLLYPGARAIPHKVCKVETKYIPLETDGYEYSLSHYKNLTCKETNDRPFQYKTTHSEYCVVFHHPHERVNCQTKYTRVPLFRRKGKKHHWEKITQQVAVGCDCAIGLKYL